MGEKQAYWDRVDEAVRNPYKYFSINTDGMDQVKTALPVHVGDDVSKVTQHLQGKVMVVCLLISRCFCVILYVHISIIAYYY